MFFTFFTPTPRGRHISKKVNVKTFLFSSSINGETQRCNGRKSRLSKQLSLVQKQLTKYNKHNWASNYCSDYPGRIDFLANVFQVLVQTTIGLFAGSLCLHWPWLVFWWPPWLKWPFLGPDTRPGWPKRATPLSRSGRDGLKPWHVSSLSTF